MAIKQMNDAAAGGLTRRAALAGGAGLSLSSVMMPAIVKAADEPIKIGMILAKQGPLAAQIDYLNQGCYLAMDQAGNKLLGRPAEIIWLDEPNPQTAQQNMQRLIDEQKVTAVVGGAGSATALAISATAKRNKIPFVCPNAAAREITGAECSRYIFRVNQPVPVHARAMATYLPMKGKKWYFITASFAFGQDILRTFRGMLKEAGGTEAGIDEVPFNTADYSSFILKIRQTRPDFVCCGLSSGDLSSFLKQWSELGMKDRIPMGTIAIGDTDMWAIGPEAMSGIFTKMWDSYNPNMSPTDKAFRKAYVAKFQRPPADKSWMGWIGMKSMLESIEMAKSTEPAAIVKALENWSYTSGSNTLRYREWDHQLLAPCIVVKAKPKITDKFDYFDIMASVPENQSDLEPLFGSREEVGCKMESI